MGPPRGHVKCPFIVTRYTTVFPPGPLPPLTEASAFSWVVTTADIHDGAAPPCAFTT